MIDLKRGQHDFRPFFTSIGVFICGYLGLMVSLYPWMVPYHYTFWACAASNYSLSIMLIGVSIALPLIIVYTAYCYWVFRGKVDHEKMY